MPTQPNPSEDVSQDQTSTGGDVKPGITGVKDAGDQAAFDIIAELQDQESGGQPAEEQPEDDTTDKSKTTSQNEGERENETEDPEKPEAEEPEPGEDQGDAPKEKEAEKEAEESKPDGEEPQEAEPFAVLGDKKFQTKEQLVEFVNSQSGYNRWFTGMVKKVHPEWFKTDGSIDASKVEGARNTVVEESEDGGEAPAFSDQEKERLRKAGFVFKEDLEQIQTSIGRETTETEIDTFEKAHPQLKNHYDEVSELMESTINLPPERRLTLEQAWGIVSTRNGIVETKTVTPPSGKTFEQGLKEGKKKSGLDTQIPTSTPRKSGVAPKGRSSGGDIFDDAIAANGL